MFPTDSVARSAALPADLDHLTRLVIMLSACLLQNSKPELSPVEAVRDAWQLYHHHIQSVPLSPWPW